MPTLKLNRKNLKEITPAAKVTTYFDDALTGFGLKVMPSGSRSWIVEYRPGVGGRGVAKKRLRIGGTELDPETARDAAQKILASVRLGSDPSAARTEERQALSLKDLADEFMKRHVQRKRKPNTIAAYQTTLDVHVLPALGTKKAILVSTADVARMHDNAADKRAGDRTQGGPYVANKALAVVSSAYEWGAQMGLVPKGTNPAAGIEKFDEKRRERFLTSEEFERLGDALIEAETIGLPYQVDEGGPKAKHAAKLENRRTKIAEHVIGAIRLYLLTSCRLREILHLRWSEVDFQRGMLFLPDSKTGQKPVVLSAAAIDVITALPRLGQYVIASDSAGTDDEKPRHDIKKPWASICKHAKLGNLRVHDLRHSFASVGAGDSLGLPIIGKLLGHSQPATTARYAHLDVNPVRRAADLIANQINAAVGGPSGKASS
jgi:integrase